eukprot:GDKJ01000448.1.p2 GENE.GDKJ01000448.1~~GDKJ01000448.1.p2  ORF type:complete len:118 (-),score=4.02 GDKJ01000448.1:145-498(-)
MGYSVLIAAACSVAEAWVTGASALALAAEVVCCKAPARVALSSASPSSSANKAKISACSFSSSVSLAGTALDTSWSPSRNSMRFLFSGMLSLVEAFPSIGTERLSAITLGMVGGGAT